MALTRIISAQEVGAGAGEAVTQLFPEPCVRRAELFTQGGETVDQRHIRAWRLGDGL